ncbi:MAG TPA: hypothetical protein PKB04_05355, partial [Phenylobacterium sp.]|nr:hypothetical protein [Phenylobacterium sp.]
MARRAARFPAAAAALLLAACSPGLEGLDEDVLNREIGARIGDPTTCVLIARPDGTVVYRYGG